jgi:hypothetical protein
MGRDVRAMGVKSGCNQFEVSGLASFVQSFPLACPMVLGFGAMTLKQWMQKGDP